MKICSFQFTPKTKLFSGFSSWKLLLSLFYLCSAHERKRLSTPIFSFHYIFFYCSLSHTNYSNFVATFWPFCFFLLIFQLTIPIIAFFCAFNMLTPALWLNIKLWDENNVSALIQRFKFINDSRNIFLFSIGLYCF